MDYSQLEYPQGLAYAPTPDPFVQIMWATFFLVFALVILAGMWQVFSKAGQSGWKVLVPIYNTYVLLQIVGKPGWWLLLYFVPFVNIAVAIIVLLNLAKVFGKSPLFAIFLLIIFSPIGMVILGFGQAKYQGKIPQPTPNIAKPAQPQTNPPTPAPTVQTSPPQQTPTTPPKV